MLEAAEIAQATEFIEAKPDKYESQVAQGGNNVSGGQKQRLSIARAIARDPMIYIFDDSFSALDFKTDAALRKAAAKEGVTLIGTLGILDQLFDGELIDKEEYRHCLQELKNNNGGQIRLPKGEIEYRLQKISET